MRCSWLIPLAVLAFSCGPEGPQAVSTPPSDVPASHDLRDVLPTDNALEGPEDLAHDLRWPEAVGLAELPSYPDLVPEPDVPLDVADSQDAGFLFSGPCDFAPLGDAPGLPATQGDYVTGDFTVTLGPVSSLSVAAASSPDHRLFATAPVADYLAGLEATVIADEKQGSFQISTEVSRTCTTPQIKSVVAAENRVLFRGKFKSNDECKSEPFEIRFCQPQSGHLSFSVELPSAFTHVRLGVESAANETIVGLGEQFAHDSLNLKGRVIPIIAQEGGVGRGHPVISPAVNLVSAGSSGSQDSTYYATPFFFTDRRRGLFLENTEVAEFDFQGPLESRMTVHSNTIVGRILAADSPLGFIEAFTAYAGRMPGLPGWVHQGAIVALARPLSESLDIVDNLRQRGARIAAVWNQTWSGVSKTFIGEQVLWNWVQNPNHHPGWHDYVASLAADDIRTLCYVNSMFRDLPEDAGPGLRNLFQEGLAADYFVHGPDDLPLMLEVTAFDVGLLDLTNPDARTWMKGILMDEMVAKAGCSGWMADFAEALPFDAHLHDGSVGADYHNIYPVEWARLNREALEEAGLMNEVLFFNRSGHTRTTQYAMLLWEGDQLTTWDKYDGMISALHGLLNGGLSGIAFNHSDTGGYTSLSQFGLGYSREALQLKRWTEMNAFTAVLRTHEGNQPGENAQVYSDDEAMAHFARFTKVYKALAFYRKQLEAEAAQKGWPIVRHLLLHYPEAPEAWSIDDQFLLGEDLLVAPTLDKCPGWPFCNNDRVVVFPPGTWVHVWTGTEFDGGAGWLSATVQAPVGEPAVFYRKGAAMVAEFLDNLAADGI